MSEMTFSQMMQDPSLNYQLAHDPEADANREFRTTLPPSELAMGAGKPYRVAVAFVNPDREKRWTRKDKDKQGQPIPPWMGTQVQYTLIGGTAYDGQTVNEFLSTIVFENSKTSSIQGFLQAMGAWVQPIPRTPLEMAIALENAIARNPVIGIHVDWEGQRKTDRLNANGKAEYEKIDGLTSWRDFPKKRDAEGKPVPNQPEHKIEMKDAQGNVTSTIYASARVVRREAIQGGSAPAVGGFGVGNAPAWVGGGGVGGGVPVQNGQFAAPPLQQQFAPQAQQQQAPAQQQMFAAPPQMQQPVQQFQPMQQQHPQQFGQQPVQQFAGQGVPPMQPQPMQQPQQPVNPFAPVAAPPFLQK